MSLANITETASDNEPGSSSYKSDLKYFLPHLEDDSPDRDQMRNAVNFQNVMQQNNATDTARYEFAENQKISPVSPESGVVATNFSLVSSATD